MHKYARTFQLMMLSAIKKAKTSHTIDENMTFHTAMRGGNQRLYNGLHLSFWINDIKFHQNRPLSIINIINQTLKNRLRMGQKLHLMI